MSIKEGKAIEGLGYLYPLIRCLAMDNLIKRTETSEYGFQSGTTVAGMIVGLIIGVVLVVAVAIPVTNGVITSSNITDSTQLTVLKTVPIILAMVPVVMVAQMF